ncbi:hypothetical protein VTN96DRAFT_9850 [Rasamsonia emersonii]
MAPLSSEIPVISQDFCVSAWILYPGLLVTLFVSLAASVRHQVHIQDREDRDRIISESASSSENQHAKDTCRDEEAARDESASPPLPPLPALGPPLSACDILRPLSHLAPAPTSGLVASLARQKSQQKVACCYSLMQDDPPQSESGTNTTTNSAGIQEEPKAYYTLQHATGHPPIKSCSEGESTFKKSPSCSGSGPLDVQSLPTPSATTSPEGLDQYTVFSRRYDERERLGRESVEKRSETVQLFRGEDDDRDEIWSRRVVEYR